MVDEKNSTLRAGLPAILFGVAFAFVGYMAGAFYNVLPGAVVSPEIVAAGAGLFAISVKLADNLK